MVRWIAAAAERVSSQLNAQLSGSVHRPCARSRPSNDPLNVTDQCCTFSHSPTQGWHVHVLLLLSLLSGSSRLAA